MKITIEQLKDFDACEDQRDLFAKHFGTEVEITEVLCAEVAGIFDWGWAAENLLSNEGRVEWERAVAVAAAPHRARLNWPGAKEWSDLSDAAQDAVIKANGVALKAITDTKAIEFARAYNASENRSR